MTLESLEKSLCVMISLLVNIQAEQQTLHTIIAADYVVNEGDENDFFERYTRLKNENMDILMAAINSNYIIKEDVNAMLMRIFSDVEQNKPS